MSVLGHGVPAEGKSRTGGRKFHSAGLAFLLLGPLAGYALGRLLPATYVSSARLGWKEVSLTAGRLPAKTEAVGPGTAFVEQRILTGEHLTNLMDQFGLYAQGSSTAPEADRAARMRQNLAVVPVERGFTVSFSAGDARLAQKVCAGIVNLFLEENRAAGAISHRADSASMNAQVQEAKRKVDQQEARLAEFRRLHSGELDSSGLAADEDNLMSLNARLADIAAALDRATEDKALTENLLRQELTSWHAAGAPGAANSQAIEQELAAKQSQLAALETRYTPDHPDVVKLRNDIAQLQKKLVQAHPPVSPAPQQSLDVPSPGEPAQITQTRDQIHRLEAVIRERTVERQRLTQEIQAATARRASATALSGEYESLTSSYTAAQSAYDSLLAKQKQAEAAEAGEPTQMFPQFEVTSPPSLPDRPSSPQRMWITLGGAGCGIGLGLLTLLVGAWSDTTLRTEADVQRYLGLPTLAVLPTTGPEAAPGRAGPRGSGRGKGDAGSREESVLVDV